MKYAVIGLAVVTAAARFFMQGHPVSPAGSYEAFAHLFVGGLIGAGNRTDKVWCWWLAGALSVVEVIAFLTLRNGR